MEIFKCRTDGHLSLTDQTKCQLCNEYDWKPIDPASLKESEWKALYCSLDEPEDEFRVLEAWAETGSKDAQEHLALSLLGGDGCDKDEKRGFEILKKLSEKQYADILTELGICYIYGCGVESDPEKGLALLWKARDMKDADAPLLLGTFYDEGRFVRQDKKKATKLFKQAAEQGSAMGMFNYSTNLVEKHKSTKDVETGIYWLWRSASLDLPQAQLSLGITLNNPNLPFHDEDQAIYWMERAMENDCDGAASAFAEAWMMRYAEGNEDGRDFEYVINTLKNAMDRGDSSAAKTLGDFYMNGIYFDRNPEMAFRHYRMGQSHNPECVAAVAHCYHYGLGVAQNVGLAKLMLSDIIDVDADIYEIDAPSDALVELGDMYRDGEGVAANQSIAAKLYACAAEDGSPCAIGRIAREMLNGNPYIKTTDFDPINLLKEAASSCDADSMVYLAEHYLSIGDREESAEYVMQALIFQGDNPASPAYKLAEKEFPELLTDGGKEEDFHPDGEDAPKPQSES